MTSESEMDAVVGQALVAQEIRRYRERAGLSLNALAARVGYSRTYISASEKPSAGLISANVVKRIDDELGANGALVALHARAVANRQTLRAPTGTPSSLSPSSHPTTFDAGHLDPPAEHIAQRPSTIVGPAGEHGYLPVAERDGPTRLSIGPAGPARSQRSPGLVTSRGPQPPTSATAGPNSLDAPLAPRLGTINLVSHTSSVIDPDVALDVIDSHVESLIGRYEIEGPRLLRPEAVVLRGFCHMMARSTDRSRRNQMAQVAARVSGLLAYMSVNLDLSDDAEAFALEASLLATAAADRELLAWIKGTQSFAAYYRGRYVDAIRHARAGLRIAGPESAQRIRLLTNGVARAAGKLGDSDTVRAAVDKAISLTGETPGRGLAPCISFAPYTHERAIANAATAYLSVGRYQDVLSIWEQLETTIERCDSDDWSRALVALDVASALARDSSMDANHAADVGVGALNVSRDNPIVSVARRGAELADDLRRCRASRAAETFDSALRDWRAHVDSFAP